MPKPILFAFAGLVAASAASAPAAPTAGPIHGAAAVAASASAEHAALARQLAQASYPRDLMIEALLKGYDEGAAEEESNAETAEIERAFPGYMDKLRVRGRQELETMMRERAGSLHARLAELYAAELTDAELRSIIDFLRTPTGAKMLRNMILAPVGEDAADDLHFTVEEVASADREAAAHAILQMSSSERAELVEFAASPAGQANRRLQAKAGQIMTEFINKLMTDFAERIDPIAMEVLSTYDKN